MDELEGRQAEVTVGVSVEDARPVIMMRVNGEETLMPPRAARKIGAMLIRAGENGETMARTWVALEEMGAPKEFIEQMLDKMEVHFIDDEDVGGPHRID